MEKYSQTKKFERIIVSCILLLVAVVGVAIYSFVALGKTRRQNAKYDEMIASLKLEQQALSNDVSYMDTPEFLEDKARNELGMIKEGEVLYIFK